MAGDTYQEIVLHLGMVDELFVGRALDPLNGRFHSHSGVDELVIQVDRRALVRPLRATIALPGPIPDGLKERCQTALFGYCEARVRLIDLDHERVNRQGRKKLLFGLIFLLTCLVLAGAIELLGWMPTFLRQFLGEGLIIIGWIALWNPVDMLLFERWELVRERRVYAFIRDADVIIHPVSHS